MAFINLFGCRLAWKRLWNLPKGDGCHIITTAMEVGTLMLGKHCHFLGNRPRASNLPRTGIDATVKCRHNAWIKKCSLSVEKIDYLGHAIQPRKLEIAETTTKAIRELQDPKIQTEVRSFLELGNVFRRFVPKFSKLTAPLNKKLRKDPPKSLLELTIQEKQWVDDLNETLTNPPILALAWATSHYTLKTDAYDTQLGCVLLQQQPDRPEKPIDYWPRIRTDTENELVTTHKEWLVVIWAVLLLWPSLEGNWLTLRTNHEAPIWVLTRSNAWGKLARWRLRLSEFKFDIVHRDWRQSGPTNQNWTTRYQS